MEQDAIERRGLKQLLLEPETLQSPGEGRRPGRHHPGLQGPDAGGDPPDGAPGRRRDRRGAAPAPGEADPPGGAGRPAARPPQPRSRLPATWTSGAPCAKVCATTSPRCGKIIPERIYFFANQRRYHEWRDRDPGRPERLDGRVGGLRRRSSPPSSPPCPPSTRAWSSSTPSVADVSDQLSRPGRDALRRPVRRAARTSPAPCATAPAWSPSPEKTLFLLISDLYEGGDRGALLRSWRRSRRAG